MFSQELDLALALPTHYTVDKYENNEPTRKSDHLPLSPNISERDK